MRRLRLWLARLVAPKGADVFVCSEDFLQRLVDYMRSGVVRLPLDDEDDWTYERRDEPVGVTWARDEPPGCQSLRSIVEAYEDELRGPDTR